MMGLENAFVLQGDSGSPAEQQARRRGTMDDIPLVLVASTAQGPPQLTADPSGGQGAPFQRRPHSVALGFQGLRQLVSSRNAQFFGPHFREL